MTPEFKIDMDGLWRDSKLVLKWVDPYDFSTVNRVRDELSETFDANESDVDYLLYQISTLEDEFKI